MWSKNATTKKRKISNQRLVVRFQKSKIHFALLTLSALFMTACTTPQGVTISNNTNNHKVQSAHSNDIWERVRSQFTMPELQNSEVTAKENYYASRADYVGRMAGRSGDFLYLIMDEVERRRLPSELAILPFIESAFVTSAQSSAKASGLWQFMPATGRDFSLQQNRFVDQRNDVMASTSAALDYLERLHNMFGDWHLALAAYNWGQGNVSRAVNRSLAAGGSGAYTDINMPLETRQYVPKLQAIKNIVRNPSMYGITLPTVPNRLRHEAIVVTRDIDITTAADIANLPIDEFKRLNPAYKKPVIVAALNSKILVPADRADDMRRAFSDRSRQLSSLTTYTTFSSEALRDIAAKYKTDENRLRDLNGIPYNHNYVRADSTLIVPRTRKDDEISYIALNSSVRSMTGDIGINDYDNYGTPTLMANADGAILSAPVNTPPATITARNKPDTGLVATTADADQLSQLISSAPSAVELPVIPPARTSKLPTVLPEIPKTASVTNRPEILTMPPVVESSRQSIVATPAVISKPVENAPITNSANEPTQITQLNSDLIPEVSPAQKDVIVEGFIDEKPTPSSNPETVKPDTPAAAAISELNSPVVSETSLSNSDTLVKNNALPTTTQAVVNKPASKELRSTPKVTAKLKGKEKPVEKEKPVLKASTAPTKPPKATQQPAKTIVNSAKKGSSKPVSQAPTTKLATSNKVSESKKSANAKTTVTTAVNSKEKPKDNKLATQKTAVPKKGTPNEKTSSKVTVVSSKPKQAVAPVKKTVQPAVKKEIVSKKPTQPQKK